MRLSNHGAAFTLRDEPTTERLVSETYTNERDLLEARVTDHAMLTPLPAPGGRAARMQYVFTEREVGAYDPRLTGEKMVPVAANAAHAPLQDMLSVDTWHSNTFRIESEPWDDNLYG